MTAIQYSVPVKVILLNSASDFLKQGTEAPILTEHNDYTLDFIKLADAYGSKGIRINCDDEISNQLSEGLFENVPVIIDIKLPE